MVSRTTNRFNAMPHLGTKAPVKVVATTNIDLIGHTTIDGYVTTEADRILLIGQTVASQNGIWLASINVWERAPDWNKSGGVISGVLIGNSNNNLFYRASFPGDFTIDLTEPTFEVAIGVTPSAPTSPLNLDASSPEINLIDSNSTDQNMEIKNSFGSFSLTQRTDADGFVNTYFNINQSLGQINLRSWVGGGLPRFVVTSPRIDFNTRDGITGASGGDETININSDMSMIGQMTIAETGATLVLQDDTNAEASPLMQTYVEFRDVLGTTVGTMGYTFNGDNTLRINNNVTNGDVQINAGGGLGEIDLLGIVTYLGGDLDLPESADHRQAPLVGFGKLWVRNDTPNRLMFTDDAGTDYDLLATLGSTPSLNGVQFPATQVPSSDVNMLDDYEEGTYTPDIGTTGTGVFTLDAAGNELSYVKVGRKVTVKGAIIIGSVTAATGTFEISLPFAARNESTTAANWFIGKFIMTNFPGTLTDPVLITTPSINTVMEVQGMNPNDLIVSSTIWVDFTYWANA